MTASSARMCRTSHAGSTKLDTLNFGGILTSMCAPNGARTTHWAG